MGVHEPSLQEHLKQNTSQYICYVPADARHPITRIVQPQQTRGLASITNTAQNFLLFSLLSEPVSNLEHH